MRRIVILIKPFGNKIKEKKMPGKKKKKTAKKKKNVCEVC